MDPVPSWSRYYSVQWWVAEARLNNASWLFHPLEEICAWALCKHLLRNHICPVSAYTRAQSSCWSCPGGHCLARSARSASQTPKHVTVLGSPPVEQCSNLPSRGIADGLGCSVIAGVGLLEKNGKVWQPPFCPRNCKVQHTGCNPGPLCVSSAVCLPPATTEIHRKKNRVWPCLITSALVCQKWGKT